MVSAFRSMMKAMAGAPPGARLTLFFPFSWVNAFLPNPPPAPRPPGQGGQRDPEPPRQHAVAHHQWSPLATLTLIAAKITLPWQPFLAGSYKAASNLTHNSDVRGSTSGAARPVPGNRPGGRRAAPPTRGRPCSPVEHAAGTKGTGDNPHPPPPP